MEAININRSTCSAEISVDNDFHVERQVMIHKTRSERDAVNAIAYHSIFIVH